ncbi:MAG: hypothetical protein ABSE48_02455 [Verrucomicrobiota bacterium]
MPPLSTDQPANQGSSGARPALPSAARQWLAQLLSLFMVAFLANAVISLADDSLILFKQVHALSNLRFLVGLVDFLATILVYGLMALTPVVPKRFFLPLTLMGPVSMLLGMFFLIYFYAQLSLISWLTSCLQVVLGFGILFLLREPGQFGWPLVPISRLTGRGFSWRNLILFVAANVVGLLPAAALFLFMGIGVAVHHFTGGFMTLHPSGFTVQERTYVRDDGKTIQLFPMAHVAESDFYRDILQTFPTNATILMEGVTDEQNLLTNKISYKRMANSLGLAEQHEKFLPTRGKIVRADIDVDQFSTDTIALLNEVMLIHTQGINPTNMQALLQYSPPPNFDKELLSDLLLKRNQHLVEEIQDQLPQTKFIVVPWGVAHMPGIAKAIQKLGFRLETTEDYTVIRFFHPSKPAAKAAT